MSNLETGQEKRLTRKQVQPLIERLGRVTDHGWTFSELALMALISEVEDLIRAEYKEGKQYVPNP